MFKKSHILFVLIVVCFLFACAGTALAAETTGLDLNNQENGSISYGLDASATGEFKLMLQKQGGTKYYYDLKQGHKESFALQFGNGEYTVTLLQKISGTQYRVLKAQKVTLELEDNKKVFLNSVQNVKWQDTDQAIIKAQALTANLKTDSEKIAAIYNYVINNVKYDQAKANTVKSGYLPNINTTYSTNKGICYDYASLFGAMLRSVGIPTKLVMGTSTYTKDTYHAWNEVYSSTENQWLTIDTTVDATLKSAANTYQMKKDVTRYTVDKIY